MKKFNALSLWLTFLFCSLELAAQNGLSVIDMQVSGPIKNYVIEDLDLDGRNDLIVSYVTDDKKKSKNRFLAVFLQTADGFQPEPNQIITVDDDAVLYDIANVTGDAQKEIIYINSRGIFYYPMVKGLYRRENAKLLFETYTMFAGADPNNFEYYDFGRVITNATYDDLLIPLGGTTLLATRNDSKNKYSLLTELNTGVTLKVKRDSDLGFVNGYQQGYIIEVLNLNNDQLLDLAFIFGNHIDIYIQGNNKEFGQLPDKEITFKSGSQKTQTQIKMFQDLNGDGLSDVFLERVDFSDRLDLKKEFEFYFGSRDSRNIITMAAKPDYVLTQNGVLVKALVEDIDGDSKFDLSVLSYDIGVTNLFNTFLASGIKVNYHLYMQKGNTLAKSATYQKDIDQEINIRRDYFRNLFYNISCDLNGDGLKELISFRDDKTLVVYLGNQRTYLSTSKSYSENITIPENGMNVSSHHIFSKQKDDLVIRYDHDDPPALRNTLKIISK